MRIGLADGKALLGIVCVVSYFRILGGLYAIMDGFGCFFFLCSPNSCGIKLNAVLRSKDAKKYFHAAVLSHFS
jgi:hypothetical protein